MKKQLNVYLKQDLVGHLGQDESGEMWFQYTREWCAWDGALALSLSLPLREEVYSRKACAGFFGGVLPEGKMRKLVAKNVGRSAGNDYALLEEIGGDCAGAVSFLAEDEVPMAEEERVESLDYDGLLALLAELPRRPLMAGKKEVRLSLAGAQNKLAVRCDKEGAIALPLGNTASTHIMKPEEEHFEGLAENEAFCLKLAQKVGLPAVDAEVRVVGEFIFLLVERYDRALVGVADDGDDGVFEKRSVRRLHQEDFCQAMGVVSEMKYQNEGGPTLEQCFELIRQSSDMPGKDVLTFFDAVVFNFLIGNNDAHGKNFSFLYRDGTVRLAPLYDLVSTMYYPELSQKLAMKIGGEYRPAWLKQRHWHRMFELSGLSVRLAERRALALADRMEKLGARLAETELQKGIVGIVKKQVEILRRALP